MKQWLVRRGVLATVPVASLVLAFGACSSESAPPNGDDSAPTKAGTLPQMGGAELAADPTAARRLARLTKQFVRAPQQAEAPRSHAFPAGVVPPTAQPASELIPARPVLSKGEANAFVRQGERFRAEIDPGSKEKVLKHANVDLPATANGFVRIQADRSSLGVEFATQRARGDSELTVAEGIASYASGAPEGGDLLFRVTADAVEDFVVLEKRPATARIDYTVKVSEVPGLRLYDNTLEFLDATGDPQIRVKPPRVVDADGVMHEAKLAIAGCKYDTSGQLPWDRPVTAPGASECQVSVTWNDQQVAYPAIVDPVWATAGSLAVARYRAAAVRLSTGYVMTCGGIGDIGVALASCETFNPAGNGGAGTWASATAMGTARNDHTMFVLSPASTDVLAVGGNNVYTSERLAAGVWTASTGDFGTIAGCPQCTPYFSPQMPAKTSDGKYVVLVDYAATPYVFTTATNTWALGTQNPTPIQQYRYSSMVLTIPGQSTIMRLGGEYSGTTFTTGERYNPATDSWAAPGNAAAMTVPRSSAAVAILDPNRVMVYGGYTGAAYSSTAEIYNATANTWAFSTGPIPNGQSAGQYNRGVTFAFHGSGKMLSNTDQGMYIYDPAAAATPWSVLYPNNFNNLGSQANVASAGAKVLMVPVWPSGGPSGAQTACRLFDFGDKGSQCNSTGECQSGLTCVVDTYYGGIGVCCDTACTGTCSSCQAAHKTSGVADGTCGPRKAEYVGDACPATAASTCGTSGYYCDGAGACAKWSNTTQCGAGSCLDGDTQNDVRYCDGKGTCTAQTTSDCTTGYQCKLSSCETQCYNNTDYCTSNYYCQDFQSPYYTCQPKKSNGSACSYPVECTTGNCVDGVCCDLACDGLCEACTNALTGSSDGSCKPITTGTDPQGDCDDNGAGSCDQNGLCNGAGACQLYASGTQCDDIGACASETSRHIPDTCNGTGSCVDKGTQACSTGYSCQAGVCNKQCASDAQCASSYWCDTVSKICVADHTSGQSCARDQMCTGNVNCVDGVCCDSQCSGTCRSCLKNQTGKASDGLCGDILDDTDPSNECTKDVGYPTSCKAPGTCDGAGACRVYAKVNTVSVQDTCSGAEITHKTCDGAGNQQTTKTPCYPYQCDAGGAVCRAACTAATEAQDCADGSFCQDGSCVGQKPIGSACRSNAECKPPSGSNTGFCTDIGVGSLEGDIPPDDGAGGAGPEPEYTGVCCDRACGDACDACKKSIKGQGSDGTCGFVKDHTDPADDCPIDTLNPCGYNGECNGAGACRNVPSGTSCGDTTCVGNSVQGQRCDGAGACVNNDGTTACAPYVCRDVNGAEQCTNPCAADDDCQDGYYCVEQSCKKKLANGATCDTSGICSSGFCVDGVCCDTSCNGQCAACDNAGSEGICSAVKGDPHGNRTQCDHAGEECGGSCDGVNAAACKYVANGTACGETTCDNGLAKSSECNGQGECRANKAAECSPYVCGTDDTCLTRCEQDADCSQGYACDETTQRCLPAVVAAECSEDRLSSVGQNGISTPCKPFLCVPASGTCAVSCAFTTDCAPDFVCEASTKTCLPTPPESEVEDESCACRAAGAAPTRHGYLALALFGLALGGLRRRKRSRNCPARSAKPAGFAQGPHPFE